MTTAASPPKSAKVTWLTSTSVGAGSASGVTKLLQKAYYPHYRYRGGAKGERGKGPKGMRRGTLVDVDVRKYVRALESGEAWRPSHPLTTKFVQALKVLRLHPVAAQTLVGDPAEGLGTGVDLVAMDEASGELVLVELKCGFNSYADKGTGHMLHELSAYPNSPRYQHQAQLAVTAELFRRTFGVAPRTAYVLCANDHGVSYHELEPEFKRAAAALVARLAALRKAT